jgi:hypothetical protein
LPRISRAVRKAREWWTLVQGAWAGDANKQPIAADLLAATTNDSAGQRRGVGLALEGADGIKDTLEPRFLAAAHGLVVRDL